ncbi:unnamed protein product [Eretmochelys imbricata]
MQCVIGCEVLSAESMKPCKLQRHPETQHPELKNRNVDFFKRREEATKAARPGADGSFRQQMSSALEASYVVSLRTACTKAPRTVGEELILPAGKEIVALMVGKDTAKKLNMLSMSNDTVKRRICEMSEDIKKQVVYEIKHSAFSMFSLQLDETTHVTHCAHQIAFIRYVNDGNVKEEFLFCEQIETTTTAQAIFNKVNAFFRKQWH